MKGRRGEKKEAGRENAKGLNHTIHLLLKKIKKKAFIFTQTSTNSPSKSSSLPLLIHAHPSSPSSFIFISHFSSFVIKIFTFLLPFLKTFFKNPLILQLLLTYPHLSTSNSPRYFQPKRKKTSFPSLFLSLFFSFLPPSSSFPSFPFLSYLSSFLFCGFGFGVLNFCKC